MTQRIKLLSVILTALILTNCKDGPSGRRVMGGSMIGQQQQVHSMTGDNFSSQTVRTPMLPPELIRALTAPPLKDVETDLSTLPVLEKVDFSTALDWQALCQNYIGTTDTDGDSLPDGCEVELLKTGEPQYAALDSHTPNGWLLSGVYINKKDKRLALTEEERREWNKDVSERGGLGFGNVSPEAYQVIKKFSALKKLYHSDVQPFSEIFYNYSEMPIRVDANYLGFLRNKDYFLASDANDARLGFATGDGIESIPYHYKKPATSVAGLTGYGKDTDSYREHGRFKVLVYETNYRIPAKYKSYQVTVAYLTGENPYFAKPPKSGMYYLINNGETVLLRNQFLNDHGRRFEGSRFGEIIRTAGCDTARLIVIYVTNGSSDEIRRPHFPELVAFRGSENEAWTVPTQGQLSIQPQGGASCQQSFGSLETYAPKSLFKTSMDITRRVNGVVDLNTSLSQPGFSDVSKILDLRSGGTLADIKPVIEDAPLADMSVTQVQEFKKGLYAMAKLAKPTAEEQTFLEGKMTEADRRIKQIEQTKEVEGQLSEIEQLTTKLDPTSPSYAADVARLDQLLATLNANADLTEDQKTKLAGLSAQYTAKKAPTIVTGEQPAEPVVPLVNPDTIDFTKDAIITITPKEWDYLKDLGFTFTDDGNKMDTHPRANKKLTQAEVDQILEQLGKKLEEGTLPPEKIKSALALLEYLEDQKNVDQDKISDFLDKYDEELHPPAVRWTPEQLAYLATLDSDASEVKPGLTEDLKKWNKGFADQAAADEAKKTLVEKVEKGLLDPTKTEFTTEEREKALEEFAKNNFIDANKAEELKNKIGARAAFVDANGIYHPEYAYYITLIKLPRADGTNFSAFRFNSTIKFKKGSFEIDSNGAEVIHSLLTFVKILKDNKGMPDAYYQIEAFADGVGSAKVNQTLTDNRAGGVAKHIVGQGIEADHVTAQGKGVHPDAVKDKKGKFKEQPELRQVVITIAPESFTPKVPS